MASFIFEFQDAKSVKEEVPSAAKNSATKGASSSSAKTASTPSTGPVTEDEIRAVLLQKKPVTTQDLVNQFKSRLKSREDKDTFAAVLRRISRIQKTNTASYVVLRER
nr:transcription initiation factor IIF subunit alpha isoform X1 [Ipomoea batatas]GMD92963.1 transcription initiation factor IIF subunit alpha isoform X1 [Ipomoea batatas]